MSNTDFSSWLQGNRNIYYGIVLDNQDPLMLGRIRVHPIDENLESLKRATPEFVENSTNPSIGKWSEIDPLIFLPFLPYFVNQVPQVGERVMIIYYSNQKRKIRDRFYILGTYSSPTSFLTSGKEEFDSSRTHLDSGNQNSRSKYPPMKNLDGSYVKGEYNGVFPEPTDVFLAGRGTTDLILKNNDVILRAGKHNPSSGGQIPTFNELRGFLQLSKFNTKTTIGPEQEIIKLQRQDQQIKYLVEYDIYNPESQPQIFTGNLTIYQLPDKGQKETKTSSFTYDSDLTGFTSSKVRIINIDTPLSLDEFAKFVSSQLITLVNKPTLLLGNLPNGTTTANTNDSVDGIQFPFYYRPSKRIRDIIKNTPFNGSLDLVPFSNMQKLQSKINISTTDVSPGYGLVLDAKLSPEIPFKPSREKTRTYTTEVVDSTVGLMGANSLYFLSNQVDPANGKTKINFNTSGATFNQSQIDNELFTNTSSSVRGEELLELLESIVGFLVSHVHPYPLLPPSSVAYDGTTTDDLLKKMLEAYQKVLNSNIRIN
jgi:hypothetical protein